MGLGAPNSSPSKATSAAVTLCSLGPTTQPLWGGDGSSRMTAKIKRCPDSFWGCQNAGTPDRGPQHQELLSQFWEVQVSGGHAPPASSAAWWPPGLGLQVHCSVLCACVPSTFSCVSLFCLLVGPPPTTAASADDTCKGPDSEHSPILRSRDTGVVGGLTIPPTKVPLRACPALNENRVRAGVPHDGARVTPRSGLPSPSSPASPGPPPAGRTQTSGVGGSRAPRLHSPGCRSVTVLRWLS